MAFIDGLLLFCKCSNSGANNESSAVEPPVEFVWFPTEPPIAANLGVEFAEPITNDPEFKLDAPDKPLEFIDNSVKPEFILDSPVLPVIPDPIPVFPEFNPIFP